MAAQRSRVEFCPTGLPVGIEVLGVDLSQQLDTVVLHGIEQAFNNNGVLFFRGQSLSPENLLDFSRAFGALEAHVRQEFALPGYPEIHLVSNIKEGERSLGSAYAGDDWHTDLCFMKEPSRCSVLYAVEVPMKDGKTLGDTEFCSTAFAYNMLREETKQKLNGRRAIFQYHRAQTRKHQQRQHDYPRLQLTPEQKAMTPDIAHPAVRCHPVTGQNCLYVNQTYTFGIEGMTEEESRPLLAELYAHITRPRYVYRHNWRVGDVLMWDNCLTQHRAIGDYVLPQRRLMYRTSVKGPMPFPAQRRKCS
ncbi:MAG TPA: TauD/TfdA family dioxygenase [Burkholderiales bacterium]|nr:TauD/TfdA family dioxygenase [Burkholderiales bacterium]